MVERPKTVDVMQTVSQRAGIWLWFRFRNPGKDVKRMGYG